MRCPYCGNGIAKKIEYADLSFKRRAVLDFVMRGGPKGVRVEDLRKRFFFNGNSDITMRTTVHYINKKILPNQIICKGGVVKLIRRE